MPKKLEKNLKMKKKDSLKINQNKDGSFTAEWDKKTLSGLG